MRLKRDKAAGPPGTACPYCEGQLRITRVTCADCELSLEGDLTTPRLYRLSAQDQRFIEQFVLASGSRLDAVIGRLESARGEDEQRKVEILDGIESGRIAPRRGMRMIEDL